MMRCDFVAFLESFVSVETLKSRAEATDALRGCLKYLRVLACARESRRVSASYLLRPWLKSASVEKEVRVFCHRQPVSEAELLEFEFAAA